MKKYTLIFVILLSFQLGCTSVSPLVQGYFYQSTPSEPEKIDCILSDNVFNTTNHYTLLQCDNSPNDFFFIPGSLYIEKDIYQHPLMFSQYINKKTVNIIVKLTYDKSQYIQAYQYIKSINASYSLHLLPIHSISISKTTTLPLSSLFYQGYATYNYFEALVAFQAKGEKTIVDLRKALLNPNGLNMQYQYKYLIRRNGTLVNKTSQATIYINNINF